MAAGIAVLDDNGVTHWASYSTAPNKAMNSARAITRAMQARTPPRHFLVCDAGQRVRQVRRVSTRVRDVSCMACVAGFR